MRLSAIAFGLLLFPSAGFAQESRQLSGAEIAQQISGNTVEGSMAAGGPYKEFYLPDGTLRGSNYEGRWRVVGDTLCFNYDPATPDQCWGANVTKAGEILWIKNGIVDGSGEVQPGNPAKF